MIFWMFLFATGKDRWDIAEVVWNAETLCALGLHGMQHILFNDGWVDGWMGGKLLPPFKVEKANAPGVSGQQRLYTE